MKKTILGVFATSLMLTGCQSLSNHFAPLPANPSSITVTKYSNSNYKDKTTYTLTGEQMNVLYQAIQDDASHVLAKNAAISCPSYSSGMVVWDYHIVIHYPNHSDRSFTQSTTGCTFVKDDQTGATSLGNLPGLSPFGQKNSK